MARLWVGAVAGLTVLGGAAAAGYAYVDHQLRAAVDDGLGRVNAFYADQGFPPFAYERVETDVLARSVSVYGLRQAGTVESGEARQVLDTTIGRIDAVPAGDGKIDFMAYDMLSHVRMTGMDGSGDAAGPVEVELLSPRGEILGARLDALDETLDSFGSFGWYDTARQEDVSFTIRGKAEGKPPLDLAGTIAELGMVTTPDGGGDIFLNDLEGTHGSVDGVRLHLRASDALQRIMALNLKADAGLTPVQAEALTSAVADFGRSVASFSLSGVTGTHAETGAISTLKEFALDEIVWQGDVLTALTMRLEDLRGEVPGDLGTDEQMLIESLGLTEVSLSARLDLRYEPDAGTLRLAPLSLRVEEIANVTLEASAEEVRLAGDDASPAPVSPRMVRSQVEQTVLRSVPGTVSLQVDDLGGIKRLIAALAETQDLPPAQMGMGLAIQAAQMVEPVFGREVAQRLFRDLTAFLTEKDTLLVTVAPRSPMPLALLAGEPPAEAFAVSTVVE